jgi:hypothetical protein
LFERVAIHASDVEASERFYDTVLPTLGLERGELTVGAGAPVTRRLHRGGTVDHLWVRVSDLADSRRHYEQESLQLAWESPSESASGARTARSRWCWARRPRGST